MSEHKVEQTAITTEQILEAARQNVVDAPLPANNNHAPAGAATHSEKESHAAKHGARTVALTPQEALTNAGILYAKAAACFEGLYQEQVLERMAAQQR